MNYQFGEFSLDTESLELVRSGRPVALEPQVFRLIACLVENRHRVVSKDELIELVWQGRIISDGALNTCVNSARNAVGDDGKAQAVIRTLPRRGFRFVAEVTAADAVPAMPGTTPRPLPDKPSIAVLPFVNMSGDPEQEYFSDGMAEDLITDISKISGVFVTARNSSFAFKGQATSIEEIAAQLGVRHVLEGSVRKMGAKLRVNAQLIDASSGGHVWAERYDGDMEDIFRFQDDIREQIVSALQVNLTPTDRAQAERRPTTNVAAYDLFLKGRSDFYRFTADHFLEAKRSFEQAIEIDPGFAEAYGYLSYCFFYGWLQMFPGFDDSLDAAYALAEQGVALDGRSAIAIAHLGWIQTYLRRYDQAVENFDKAIALAPHNAEIHANFGQALNYCGDPARALAMIDKAFGLDTIAPPLWEFYAGHSLLLLGRHDEAESRLLKAVEQIPKFSAAYLRLAFAYSEMDRDADARDAIKTVLQITPQYTLKDIARIYPYRIDRVRERFLDSLRRAGLPEE